MSLIEEKIKNLYTCKGKKMAKVKLVKSTCHLSNLWQEINTNSVTGQVICVNVNHASNLVKSPDKCFFG